MSAQDITLGKGRDATTIMTFDWATLVHLVVLALRFAHTLDPEDARLLRLTITGMVDSKGFPVEFYSAIIAGVPEDGDIWSLFKTRLRERQAFREHDRFDLSLEETA